MRPLFLSSTSYFRNFIFGVEDSLVSTVGLLSGVAVAGMSKEALFVTGVILILVEAISMSAGSFLSESSSQAYEHTQSTQRSSSVIAGSIMFFSYFLSGFIPLFPYVILPVDSALRISVMSSVGALFILGVIGARITGTRTIAGGLKMAFIGGFAILAGILAGSIITQVH